MAQQLNWKTFPESANDKPALGIWNRKDIEPLTKHFRHSDPCATRASEWERHEIRRQLRRGIKKHTIARNLRLTEGAVTEALRAR